MKVLLKKVLVACCMMFPCTCSAQKQQFESLPPAEFEKLLTEKRAVQLVDVRRPEEFEARHIKKAVLINVQEPDFLTKAKSLLNKSKPVAVYCRSGKRSKEAARLLSKAGFTVFDLDSGYLGWMEYINSK
jgi:rhodanese-related sulfurtransferase